jgi:hypothetical protein
LNNIHALGGGRKLALFCQGDEVLQVPNLHENLSCDSSYLEIAIM